MTSQSIRAPFGGIAPGIAAIAVAILVAAGWIAFTPGAGATDPEYSGPIAGDSCWQISQSDRVVSTGTSSIYTTQTIERTTRHRCIDRRYRGSAETHYYTYTTRVRWTEVTGRVLSVGI